MKLPDDHKAKVALRRAAAAWVVGLSVPAKGAEDREFRRLDNALLKAALNYARSSQTLFRG